MKRCSVFLVVVIACLWCGTGHSADVSVSADLNQGYVWRGMTFNDGLVLQPSIDASLPKGFGINVWANMDIDDYDGAMDDDEFSEVDITLYYSLEAGGFEFGAGIIEYLYAHQSTEELGALPGTREVYVSVSRAIIEGVSATAEVYYDFDEVDDFYAKLALAYSATISDQLGLECTGSIGNIGTDMSLGEEGGLNEFTLSATLSFSITEALSVSGTLGYTDSLDDDVLPDQDVDAFGGINVSHSF